MLRRGSVNVGLPLYIVRAKPYSAAVLVDPYVAVFSDRDAAIRYAIDRPQVLITAGIRRQIGASDYDVDEAVLDKEPPLPPPY